MKNVKSGDVYSIEFEGKGVCKNHSPSGEILPPDNDTYGLNSIVHLILDTKDHAERVFKALKHLIPFYNDKEVDYIDNISLENKF
ncbi:hypothetical protein [Gaetbulibacter aestuarii]|uniref:Uncharacterized protein n=1 Tax=Gaetbulibacter aestuarii TaxID=1502358 RepID=A0ABW7MVT3_9FLAO